MNYDEMNSELGRLNAVIGRPLSGQDVETRTAFQTELHRKFAWMMALQWKDVVTWVVEHHKTKSLPTIDQFQKAVEAMRTRGVIKPIDSCRSCKGAKLMYVRVPHKPTGDELDACVPCSVCRPGTQWPLKDCYELIGSKHHTVIEMAQSLGPRGAAYVLARIEKERIQFAQEIIEILLEKEADGRPEQVAANPSQETA